MAVFEYTGVQIESGKSVRGIRDAENARTLRTILRRDGIMLTSAQEEAKGRSKSKREIDLLAPFRRLSTSDVAVMTRQLATLVRAGIPLVESIQAVSEQVEKEMMVRVLQTVREQLNEGTAFAKALGQHPKVFPPLYVNMVAAGEASGTIEAVLERLADFMEGQAKLKGKVMSALAYPILMSIVGTVMVTVLMVTVVPKVTSIFENLGQELPWYTRVLIFTSDTLSGFWWLIAAVIAGSLWWFKRWKSRPEGRLRWDTLRLQFPIFGRLNLIVAVARLSRTLATLLASGVQLLPAMEIAKNVLENTKLEGVVQNAISSIREGESIAEPLKRSGAFPPMLTHMIAVGERSGQLEDMLENVSRSYEADVETKVATLTSLLEPMMIVILGCAVGFIVLSILSPLMQMNSLVE